MFVSFIFLSLWFKTRVSDRLLFVYVSLWKICICFFSWHSSCLASPLLWTIKLYFTFLFCSFFGAGMRCDWWLNTLSLHFDIKFTMIIYTLTVLPSSVSICLYCSASLLPSTGVFVFFPCCHLAGYLSPAHSSCCHLVTVFVSTVYSYSCHLVRVFLLCLDLLLSSSAGHRLFSVQIMPSIVCLHATSTLVRRCWWWKNLCCCVNESGGKGKWERLPS